MSKKAKDNSGFTLVELIVTIVIIAVLVGVTVVGVTKYINDARRNIDIHNVSVINNALQDLRCNEEFEKLVKKDHGLMYYSIEWKTGDDSNFDCGIYRPDGIDITVELVNLISRKVEEKFPDGYPKLNTPDCVYRITVCFNKSTGDLQDIYCGVYSVSLCPAYGIESISWDFRKNMKTYKRVY